VFRQQDIQDTIEKLRHEIIDHLIFGEDVTEKRNTLINLLRSTKWLTNRLVKVWRN